MDSQPIFEQFLEAVYLNAMKHPEMLKDTKSVWKKADKLLKDVKKEIFTHDPSDKKIQKWVKNKLF